MKALERDLEGLIHRQKCATSLAEVRAERIRKLLGNIDVSVDVHHRSGSWAVVSLQGGKTDYIKFVDLDQRSIREISAFLRQFDRQNVKIDANPLIDKCWTKKFIRYEKIDDYYSRVRTSTYRVRHTCQP